MSGVAGRLAGRVRSVVRLGRTQAVALAVAAAALTVGCAYLAASALDVALKLPWPVRLALFAGALALAVYAAARAARAAASAFRDEVAAAREVERRFPQLRTALSTSIEFGGDEEKTAAYSSPAIVERLVENTEAVTEPLPFRRAVDWRRLARAAGALAVAGAAIALYAAALPHMAGSTAMRFFAPLADAPPPTWTVIVDVAPGSVEIARGASVSVEAELAGVAPDSVKLLYRPEGQEGWQESEMVPEAGRRFTRTLARIVMPTEYCVSAGDAVSAVHRLEPYEEPRAESIRLRVTPPEYTLLGPEDLPEGTGDVRSVVGTEVAVRIRANRVPAAASLELVLGPDGKEVSVPLRPAGEDARELAASFRLDESGEYRVLLRDAKGHTNAGQATFRLKALPDRSPSVRIASPRPEVMAFRNQTVAIEIEGSDDWGLAELGIVHSLAGAPERVAVSRPEAGARSDRKKYEIKLSMHGFKGGEIVPYYGYAVDTDTMNGPKETIGELRFIHTYDESDYQSPGGDERAPKSVREIGRLIERQMAVMRETFALVSAPEGGAARKDGASRAASDQDALKRDVENLVEDVEKALSETGAGEGPGLQVQELAHLREAGRKMADAASELRAGRPREATGPQSEALAHLSRTRRIMLSESGSGSMRQAMESAESQRRNEREARRREKLDELEQEMQNMPPLLERNERARRRIEELEDEPPPPGVASDAADDQRRLAEQARQMADRMDRLRDQDPGMPSEPQRRLREAADNMDEAADATDRREFGEASRSAAHAQDNLNAARRAGAQAIRQADLDRLRGATNEAEELRRQQEDLARKTGEASERADGGQEARREADRLAERQEDIRSGAEGLASEVASLADRAGREGRPEADGLRSAERRQETRGAKERMDAAAKALRAGRPGDARADQASAARSLGELARDLGEAADLADASERNRLADAIREAEDLAKSSGRAADDARDPARDAGELANAADVLGRKARDLAGTVATLPSAGGAGDIQRAKDALENASKEIDGAAASLSRPDRASAAESLTRARDEASRAATALRSSALSEVTRAVAAARDAARTAARMQERAEQKLGEADKDPSAASRARSDAAGIEREAEAAARESRQRLQSAAEASSGLASDLATQLEREANRARREQLPERMEGMADRLGTPLPESGTGLALDEAVRREAARRESASERRGAGDLARDAAAASARLQGLFAEANDDELESLLAAAEDARRLADRLKGFERKLGERQSPDAGDARSVTPPEAAHGLAEEARGLKDDAESLQWRLARRAPELIEDDRTSEAGEELGKLATRLSRNQPAPPSGALGGAAEAYQIVGEGLVKRVEAIIKQRRFQPAEDEEAPEDYRELVERYFRALSEDRE